MKKIILLTVLSLCLLSISPARPVQADVAPPERPPGSNISPGEEITQVRMAAETVIIEVQSEQGPDTGNPSLTRAWAKVKASFAMHNTGSQDERMEARFPLSKWDGSGDGFFNYPEIEKISVRIGGNVVSTQRVTIPNPERPDDPPVAWAVFNVEFPAGKDVLIEVTYDVRSTGYMPVAEFFYVMQTGSGWKDTIGSADIIVRLPFEINSQNFIAYENYDLLRGTISGNEIYYHFEDLEPQYQDNVQFSILEPVVWQRVLNAQKDVDAAPNNGDAWGVLARSCRQAVVTNKGWLRDDPGGLELTRRAIEAYEKATTLSPNTARWHAGYAELLMPMTFPFISPGDPLTIKILRELDTALRLDPANEQAKQLIDEFLVYSIPEGVEKSGDRYIFHYLTKTPVPNTPTMEIILPQATFTPTFMAPRPSATSENISQPTLPPPPTAEVMVRPSATSHGAMSTLPPTDSPSSKTKKGGLLSCCPSLGVAPLAVVGAWALKKRRR